MSLNVNSSLPSISKENTSLPVSKQTNSNQAGDSPSNGALSSHGKESGMLDDNVSLSKTADQVAVTQNLTIDNESSALQALQKVKQGILGKTAASISSQANNNPTSVADLLSILKE